jgi:hypothetical protein
MLALLLLLILLSPPLHAAPGDCTLPWGGTIPTGSSVTAYLTAMASTASSCNDSNHSQVRTCTNGSLSGYMTNQSCTPTTGAGSSQATCTLPWGTVLQVGQTIPTVYYTNLSSDCASNSGPFYCSSAYAAANGGNVTGVYQSCSAPSSCTLPWGGSIASGSSVLAYTVQHSSNCANYGSYRACDNGVLSGSSSAQYQTCGLPLCPTGQNYVNGQCVTDGGSFCDQTNVPQCNPSSSSVSCVSSSGSVTVVPSCNASCSSVSASISQSWPSGETCTWSNLPASDCISNCTLTITSTGCSSGNCTATGSYSNGGACSVQPNSYVNFLNCNNSGTGSTYSLQSSDLTITGGRRDYCLDITSISKSVSQLNDSYSPYYSVTSVLSANTLRVRSETEYLNLLNHLVAPVPTYSSGNSLEFHKIQNTTSPLFGIGPNNTPGTQSISENYSYDYKTNSSAIIGTGAGTTINVSYIGCGYANASPVPGVGGGSSGSGSGGLSSTDSSNLQSLKDAVTTTDTSQSSIHYDSSEAPSYTYSITQFIAALNASPIGQLSNMTLSLPPATCPTIIFNVFGSAITMDYQCTLAALVAPVFSVVFTFIWLWRAVSILMS